MLYAMYDRSMYFFDAKKNNSLCVHTTYIGDTITHLCLGIVKCVLPMTDHCMFFPCISVFPWGIQHGYDVCVVFLSMVLSGRVRATRKKFMHSGCSNDCVSAGVVWSILF